jgi:NAD(P)-dependent dehydrogenase (short-subunit alcohol dehydrogenase family)
MSESNAPTVLITGATSGVGFETARRLLATGSTVLVHGPTPLSTEKAVARLVQAGADPLKIDTAITDFARLGEVVEIAVEISAKYRRIDVLVNNAALLGPAGRRLPDDGNEITFQVNYLAHFLLTRALMDRLTVTGKGRVVNVSSALHRTANINWSEPQRTKNYSPVAAYAQSKLALTMSPRAFRREQQDSPRSVFISASWKPT